MVIADARAPDILQVGDEGAGQCGPPLLCLALPTIYPIPVRSDTLGAVGRVAAIRLCGIRKIGVADRSGHCGRGSRQQQRCDDC
jgi:hypothetical protein